MKRKIAPSILAADFANLGAELERIANADLVHIDVMDGRYVPNLSYGPPIIQAVQKSTNVPLDIHLMIEEPEKHLNLYAGLGPEYITVHYEAVVHLQRTLSQIREFGCKAGVALNPHTPLDGLRYVLDDIDMILIMTVNPGFGGQSFIPAMTGKVADCYQMIAGRDIDIQVDGGVTAQNVPQLAQAGAQIFVAGSAVFQSDSPANYIELMRTT